MLDEIEFRLRTEVQALRARRVAWRARRACREDALAGYPRLKQTYLSIFGVPLDLENPRKFTEKMQWRKVYDRRPILWTLCDKQLTSLWVEKTIGPREAQRWLVPRLFTVQRASDIPFDRLPENYVIKASHGSGLNIFIRKGENALDRREIRRRARLFLIREFGREQHEWGYWGHHPVLIGEHLLTNPDGSAPMDIKFHMFGGVCVAIQCNDYGHASGISTPPIQIKTFYSPEWQKLDIRADEQVDVEVARPEQLPEMLDMARRLSLDLEYVRVDFLMVEGRVFLGEMTPYTSSGLKKFRPDGVDEWLGSLWILPGREEIAESQHHARPPFRGNVGTAQGLDEPARLVSGDAHRTTIRTDE